MGSEAVAKRVCIIGAGMTGLTAMKNVKASPTLIGTVFEQMDRVGGLWHYVADSTSDVHGLPIHSAVYESLRVNAAKETMLIDGFQFPDYEDGECYVTHRSVDRFLNDYADHFKLRENIQLSSKVLCVRPTTSVGPKDQESDTKWAVTVQNFATNTTEEHTFDAVMVANGIHFQPHVPEIPGIDDFQGPVTHSKVYRNPEPFRNQRVVIVGIGPSGSDTAREVSELAKEVIVVVHSPYEFDRYPKNVRLAKTGVERVKKNSVLLQNGEEVTCDSIILATGYDKTFPFLHADTGIEVKEGAYTWPLYQYMLSVKYPTLCFLQLIPFAPIWIMAKYQSRYFINFLEGKIQLPSESERRSKLEKEEAVRREEGIPIRKSHNIGIAGHGSFDYLEQLAQEGGFPDLNKSLPFFKTAFYVNVGRLFNAPDVFRTDVWTTTGPYSMTYTCTPVEGHEDKFPAEVITVSMDEATGVVTVSSNLGKIHNKPLEASDIPAPLWKR